MVCVKRTTRPSLARMGEGRKMGYCLSQLKSQTSRNVASEERGCVQWGVARRVKVPLLMRGFR